MSGDIASLRSPGTFGVDNVALIWLVILSVFMLIGPALVEAIYLLVRDGRQAHQAVRAGQADVQAPASQKKAA